ncbi:MAG: hypothetical protein IKM33_06700 [Clostridia bacterium]|nr:hypothetical protein [Clostridia bacterium]
MAKKNAAIIGYGGMIPDRGIHLIDQIMGIVGDNRLNRVWCKCDHITNKPVDDGCKLEMYFEPDRTGMPVDVDLKF